MRASSHASPMPIRAHADPRPRASVMRFIVASAVLFLAAFFTGCGDLPWLASNGGSATETTGGAKVTGQVVYPDGSSAVGASVVIRPADYLADTSGAADTVFHAEAVVGRDGSYTFKKVPSGDYLLEVTDANGRNAMAEFRKDTETGALTRKADTLRVPGILYGALGAMQGSPGSGFVQIFGLGRTLRADASGAFRFRGLPSGRLRVRAVSSMAHWHFRDTVTTTVLPSDSTLVAPFIPEFDEDYSAWGSSLSFFLNTLEKTKGVDVYDFPLLIRLTSSNFDFRVTNGKDIRFADGKGKHLPFAVERWDSAAGSASLWVKLDTVKAQRTDQVIHMLWNRPGAPDESDPHAVFASFSGVWHLSDAIGPDGSGAFRDASPSAADGTGKVLPGDSDGQISLARAFRNGESITAKAGPTLRPAYGVCISAWVRILGLDTLGGEIATLGGNYGLRAEPNGKVLFYLNVAGNPIRDKWKLWVGDNATTGLVDSVWHLVTGTFDGFNMRVFLDGNEAMSTGGSFNTLAYTLGQDFRIGAHGQDSAGYNFNGSIDEVQVSPKVRAPAWIHLSWENQKAGSTLIEFR
jgi:hypothetical protein